MKESVERISLSLVKENYLECFLQLIFFKSFSLVAFIQPKFMTFAEYKAKQMN